MRANPWGAGLRPAPVRSTVGLQHHHGETEWTNNIALPSRPSRQGLSASSACSPNAASSTKVTSREYSSSWNIPFVGRAMKRRLIRCGRGQSGSYRAHRIAFRFREKDVVGGYPLIGSDRRHAATFAAGERRGLRICFSAVRTAASILDNDARVAPIGSGFFADCFQRLNVVGCTPARRQTSVIGRPRALARSSIPAMICCWSMTGSILA